MADVSVIYVSKKISKLRWRPEPKNSLHNEASSIFAAGSWDNYRNNSVSLWKCPSKPNDDDLSMSKEEAADPEPEQICEHLHKGDVTDLLFVSSDLIASTSSNGSINLLRFNGNSLTEVETWEKLHRYNGSSAAATAVAAKADEIATVGESGQIALLNINRKTPVWVKEADSCALSTLGYVRQQEIVVGNIRGHLKLWDLKTKSNKATKTLSQSGEQASITCLAQHPVQSHVIISGTEDGMLSIWDLRQDHYPVSVLKGHTAAVSEIQFHPRNPEILYTASFDGGVWQWDASHLKGPKHNMQSNKIGGVSLGGLDVNNWQTDPISNPWLNCDATKHRLEVSSLLPTLTTPVNSLDIEGSTLICSSDNEAIYIVSDLK